MQLIVDSLVVNCVRKGKGKTILLLHGWGDSLESFQKLQDDLALHFDVISVDLPAFGKSQTPNQTWGLDEFADFLRDFIEKLHIQNLEGLVGHSNGGALAIRAVATKKLKPKRLVLLAAAGIRDQQSFQRYVVKVIAKVGKAATFWLPLKTRQRLRRKLYGAVGSDMFVAPHIQETFKKTVRQDVQADATQIRIPTLLVYGDKDTATPSLYGQMYQKLIADSRLMVVPGAGHHIHQEQADLVKQYIQDFLGI